MPIEINYRDYLPALLTFNKSRSNATCLHCDNPKCLYFEESEISCNDLKNFPIDTNNHVCPVEAIKWDNTLNSPQINNEICLNCGICVSRCPVGAIFFTGEKMCISNHKSAKIESFEYSNSNIKKQYEQISAIISTPHIRKKYEYCEKQLLLAYARIKSLKSSLHTLLVRNLLICLGVRSSASRIGDVYTRMDAIYSTDSSFGAVEVEFGKETLDASRAILDDIAVLYSRYGIEKESNKALVVCFQLPNERQGYWQVVKDIKKVEGIKINTVSLGALLILLWNGCQFEPDKYSYYADYDNMEIRTNISKQLGYNPDISDRLLGVLEPKK